MHQAADRVLKRKEKTMKKRVRKITAMLLAVSMVLGVSGCGKSQKSTQDSGETAKVKIAYQYGLAYAPLTIMQEQGLIEKNYDGDIEVEWVSLNSGSAINEGMASGDIDVACMGIAPFITGVTAGIPYKMYGTIAAQPNELLTNEDTIHSLKDITDDKKISVVNVGSIQHILLAMLAKQELGDAHALDNNLVTMSHPDGMTALMSGSVACQLTTAPYIFKAKEQDNIKEAESLDSVWPEGNAFIVGLVSDDLYENQPEIYQAVVDATQEAMDYINNNQEEAANILCKKEDVTAETMQEWLQDPGCVYDMKLPGVMDMANFMAENDFVDSAPESFEAITTESARKRKNKDENDEKFKKSDCFYCCCSGGMAGRLSDGFLSGTDVSVTWKDISVADQRIFAGRAGSDDALFLKPDRKRAADRNRTGIYPLRTVHRQQDVLFHLPYGRFPV